MTATTGPARSARAEISQAAARTPLFVSSYAPLFLILALRFSGNWLRWPCVALCVLGVLSSAWVLWRARAKTAQVPITIRDTADLGSEAGGYLASYLLPFVTVADPRAEDVLGYCIFLAVAYVIYVRSDLVQANPTFYLFGYRILRVMTASGTRYYLMTSLSPEPGETIQIVDVAGILLRVGSENA